MGREKSSQSITCRDEKGVTERTSCCWTRDTITLVSLAGPKGQLGRPLEDGPLLSGERTGWGGGINFPAEWIGGLDKINSLIAKTNDPQNPSCVCQQAVCLSFFFFSFFSSSFFFLFFSREGGMGVG